MNIDEARDRARHVALERAIALYRTWLAHHRYVERSQQLQIIEHIVGGLFNSDNPVAIVEAGTGSGKSIAYLVSALAVAEQKRKKLLVVTSTVMLQRQLLFGELEDLVRISHGEITYALAKGRRRYVCNKRLEAAALQGSSELRFKDEDSFARNAGALWKRLAARDWSGDMDEIPADLSISISERNRITTDALGCNGSKCEQFANCVLYNARKVSASADVVVTNYDLLLSSLDAEAELVPVPSEAIYVFDEAHNLRDKTSDSQTWSVAPHTIVAKTRQLASDLAEFLAEVGHEHDHIWVNVQHALTQHRAEIRRRVDDLETQLRKERFSQDEILRFEFGQVPNGIRELVSALKGPVTDIGSALKSSLDDYADLSGDEQSSDSMHWHDLQKLEDHARFFDEASSLLVDWIELSPGIARWVSQDDNERELMSAFRLTSVMIDVAAYLRLNIWQHTVGTVCVSATISTGGSANGLKHFRDLSGIDGEANSIIVESPFDPSKVVFRIPSMRNAPNEFGYEEEVARKLSGWLSEYRSGIVIVNSRSSLATLVDELPVKLREDCLVQDANRPIATLVELHKEKIDAGKKSYLIGMATLREGFDLPGDYCLQVVLLRLPFPVPTDPVNQAIKEMLFDSSDSLGSWRGFDLPEACLKFKQGCGRLIRREQDFGTLSVLDKRIKTKSYGKQFLRTIPYQVVN